MSGDNWFAVTMGAVAVLAAVGGTALMHWALKGPKP